MKIENTVLTLKMLIILTTTCILVKAPEAPIALKRLQSKMNPIKPPKNNSSEKLKAINVLRLEEDPVLNKNLSWIPALKCSYQLRELKEYFKDEVSSEFPVKEKEIEFFGLK